MLHCVPFNVQTHASNLHGLTHNSGISKNLIVPRIEASIVDPAAVVRLEVRRAVNTSGSNGITPQPLYDALSPDPEWRGEDFNVVGSSVVIARYYLNSGPPLVVDFPEPLQFLHVPDDERTFAFLAARDNSGSAVNVAVNVYIGEY